MAEANPVARREHPASPDTIERHRGYLFNFAVGRVTDISVAEDLVQETFLAAWGARNRYERRCSERTWLVAILRRKICNYFRDLYRQRSVRSLGIVESCNQIAWDRPILSLHDGASKCQSPRRHIEREEFRKDLVLALAKLRPRTALVFQLYAVEDQTNREVCRKMKISESNLWVMLYRARKHLRHHLAEWQRFDPDCNKYR